MSQILKFPTLVRVIHQIMHVIVKKFPKLKNAAKTCGKIMGFETTSAKSSDFVAHDNESSIPQELNIKIKE